MSDRNDQADESRSSPAGVDGTLIDEMLRLSPKQRLEQNDRMAALAVRLQRAVAAENRRDGWKSPAS
jgi:hypothetical protein